MRPKDTVQRMEAGGSSRRDLVCLHLETPQEPVREISTSGFRPLLDNVNLAIAELGAEITW